MNPHTFIKAVRTRFTDDSYHDIETPERIDERTLQMSGYTHNFGDRIVHDADGAFTPAACLHVYEQLEGRSLDEPVRFFVHGPCRRHESTYDTVRRPVFTMVEVVIIGPIDALANMKQRIRTEAETFLQEMGCVGSFEPATDAFFMPETRGAKLIQEARELKLEYRSRIDQGLSSIASINYHEDAFTRRYNIEGCHSLCLAFGVERCLLAR